MVAIWPLIIQILKQLLGASCMAGCILNVEDTLMKKIDSAFFQEA